MVIPKGILQGHNSCEICTGDDLYISANSIVWVVDERIISTSNRWFNTICSLKNHNQFVYFYFSKACTHECSLTLLDYSDKAFCICYFSIVILLFVNFMISCFCIMHCIHEHYLETASRSFATLVQSTDNNYNEGRMVWGRVSGPLFTPPPPHPSPPTW